MTVDLCPMHELTFTSMHATDGSNVNFLDVSVSVPGCHDAFGGLLGQTYQCKHATEPFVWSRQMEDAFRVPTLTTPSGTYSADGVCADESQYS